MDLEAYKVKGKETVDYIADYLKNIRNRRVFPDVKPGYLRELIPDEAPQTGENWDDIFKDVERVIMPGITHWQSPHMHAYFPALNSFPSLLGDMVSDAINCLGFTWASSPAATELESLVMDWLVKCLGLPDKFLNSNQEEFGGGGVLQTSVSESTYLALLAARTKAFIKHGVGEIDKYKEKSEINGKLVGYCSDQAHSSVEKSSLVAITRIRLIPSDENLCMRGSALKKAIEQDKKDGLIPFFVCATLGTTGACAFDNLEEIGPICHSEGIWLHIDAAYAGSAFLCPEYRKFLKGVEYASSFVFNPSKWLMVNFDCTCFWVDSTITLHQTFTVAPLYLKHKYSGAAIDYMHWQLGLSRRFRALKLWFVLRSFGIEGLQAHIRKGVELAKLFEELVKTDNRFELQAERHLGLVVFRLKGENEITENLLKQLNKDGRIHLVPARVKNNYIIRFTVTSYYTTEEDIKRDWNIIQTTADEILEKVIDEENHKFQSTLILSNVPQTPKIVNASFLAFLLDQDSASDRVKELKSRDYLQSPLPLTPRRKQKFTANPLQKRLSLEHFNNKDNIKNYISIDQFENFSELCSLNDNGIKDEDTNENDEYDSNKFMPVYNSTCSKKEVNSIEISSNLYNNNNNNNITNGKKSTQRYIKQASLDSKIQYIFEETEEPQ